MRLLTEWLEVFSLRLFFALASRLPWTAARWLSRRVGDLLYDVVRIRREVVRENLSASFPNLTPQQEARIARSCYRNFALTAVQFARSPHMTREELMEQVEVVGLEHIETARALGQGAILLTGHFGNWEWLASALPALGYPLRAVVGRQRNRQVEALMDHVRRSRGLGILNAEDDLRGLLQALQRKEFVAIVADQDAGRDGIFVEFLGRAASTAVGPVRLARRFGTPILISIGIHKPDGSIRGEFLPPIRVPRGGDDEEVVRAYTEIWSAKLEEYVVRYPEQWFWMHRRWKTRPREEKRSEET